MTNPEPDPRLADVVFSAGDLIKLIAATFLPLCDELEAGGVLDRAQLADAMGFYVPAGEFSSSATLVAALQTVLRRPRPDQFEADADAPEERESTGPGEVALRVILGGRSGQAD